MVIVPLAVLTVCVATMVLPYSQPVSQSSTPSEPRIIDLTAPRVVNNVVTKVVAPEPVYLHAWPEIPFGATPDLTCVSATDTNNAVVGGSLVSGPVTLHSCLFSTDDGGFSWKPMGPAIDGAHILSVTTAGEQVMAIGHDDELLGGEPFVLSSPDSGLTWTRHALDLGPFSGLAVTAATITMLSGQAVAALDVAGLPQRRVWLTPDPLTGMWGFERADGGRAGSAGVIEGGSGWGWRIRDGIIEQRDEEDQHWLPTVGQPLDDLEQSDPLPHTAAL